MVYRRQGLNETAIDDLLTEKNFDPEQRGGDVLPRALGFELGFRSNVGRHLNIAAAAWSLDLEREYVYVGDGGFTELSGQSSRYGVDFEVRLGITSWLSADADINFARARFVDEPADADAIPLAPRRTSSGGLTILHPGGFEANLRYVHVDSRPANEDGSIMADGFTILSTFAAYRVGPVRVHAAIENLFDIDWNEAQFATTSRLRAEPVPVSELHFTPGSPRRLTMGLAYLF
jgi:hypothetical protein